MAAATLRHNNISTTTRSQKPLANKQTSPASSALLTTVSRRDCAMSALLTGVVVVLVVCHTPKTAINIFESYHILR